MLTTYKIEIVVCPYKYWDSIVFVFVLTQENPFVFPDNVMEYGEPQFFPGNCVGYLETILEETDEEFEEEEGCSGRHWFSLVSISTI